MEGSSSEKIIALAESMEKLDCEASPLPHTSGVQSAAPGDDFDDPWCEDGNEYLDDGFNHSYLLDREWERRQEQFHTMGYRDGITAGMQASAQEGFVAGFKESVCVGYNWGLVRGITSALASLPDGLKEKLAGNQENRDSFQNVHVSVQNISAYDALKIFHDSIKSSLSTQSCEQLGDLHQLTMADDGICCNQLDTHHKKLVSLLRQCPQLKVRTECSNEISE